MPQIRPCGKYALTAPGVETANDMWCQKIATTDSGQTARLNCLVHHCCGSGSRSTIAATSPDVDCPMRLTRYCLVPLLLLLTACGGLVPGYEPPQVNITSFGLAPNSGATPRFNIGVQVVNPNRVVLPLRGMSYEVAIEGTRVLSGATPNLPTVPAFGMADFVIEASPDLLGGARLLANLFSRQRASLGFAFTARIDTGGLLPAINVSEAGSFDLPGRQ